MSIDINKRTKGVEEINKYMEDQRKIVNAGIRYDLNCCNKITDDLYLFQIIKYTGLTQKHIAYFTCFKDLSGIGTPDHKYLSLESLSIIQETLLVEKNNISKKIKAFNREMKAFNKRTESIEKETY